MIGIWLISDSADEAELSSNIKTKKSYTKEKFKEQKPKLMKSAVEDDNKKIQEKESNEKSRKRRIMVSVLSASNSSS